MEDIIRYLTGLPLFEGFSSEKMKELIDFCYYLGNNIVVLRLYLFDIEFFQIFFLPVLQIPVNRLVQQQAYQNQTASSGSQKQWDSRTLDGQLTDELVNRKRTVRMVKRKAVKQSFPLQPCETF